ncbi:type IVB secretion system protein DotA [Legionella fallonii]|uniref:Defect in organelle trafficking protein DotA n=1 Tax=Legionella fallonii LLAP-10 TaxID=1212491 RepID=A0A098G030_9GAMM|nr:type IVB secretion system protein DotA [Legionella fallonii]CEG55847.1 Defect in organelle trafficking protein DotA [Legionella fallonii LLAP-10]
MNKLVVTVLLSLFPTLVLAADGSLSFAPPASDLSVVFLGNLFGVVDGVLHGTGSQIMGTMFAVFNSAVLALGGMVIMYTLLVSTMNTAHEGQMLGQKWSSIWIPVRSTLGLALLIPKASGYCLMQIFVMWIVVQGIGAADKVWEAALGYLNRGGVIIQAQTNPTIALTSGLNAQDGVSSGAYTILVGEVCMLGLQKQLENQRQININMKNGPCNTQPISDAARKVCNSAVPDFISTVNAVAAQNQTINDNKGVIKDSDSFSVDMPNFKDGSPFYFLNGVCGTIKWNAISGLPTTTPGTGQNGSVGKVNNISSSQIKMAQMSRAIGIQQMYSDFTAVAQVMVNNNPVLNPDKNKNNNNNNNNTSGSSSTNKNYSLIAKEQFGVPYTANGTTCNSYQDTCVIWGAASTSSTNTNSGVLFNGTEFQGAMNDYNGIMGPTLNLIKLNADAANANSARAFIAQATTQGWMMAGAYFFDLVKLNGNAVKNADQVDSTVSFNGSKTGMQGGGPQNICKDPKYGPVCAWFGSNATAMLNQVQALIDGTFSTEDPKNPGVAQQGDATPAPKFGKTDIQGSSAVTSVGSASVNGFVTNSLMIQLPGQPGIAPLQFANMIHFSIDPQTYYLKEQNFDCGAVKIVFFSFCLGRMMGNLFYNAIFRYIYNVFLMLFSQIINQVIMAFLMIPLQGMAEIFRDGLKIINEPGVNPIVALANMGVMYINFSSNLWMMLLNLAITSAIIPLFGLFIFALIALALPLLLAWIGVMVTVGFTTAYYIPILPYMIFTFGTLAWIMAVIEAMVAAPVVALGVTHPEGHDAFGKGEAAIMILMNIFLRPALMIIGYISGIALSYVGVWILNAGFDHAIGFIQSSPSQDPKACQTSTWGMCSSTWTGSYGQLQDANLNNSMPTNGSGSGGYSDWAGIYAYFFSILIYTSMYLVVVQKAFTLISLLPDKVLRWIGGTPESIGQETAQWGEEVKSKVGEGSKATQDAQGQIGAKLGAHGQKALSAISKPGGGGKVQSTGSNTPPKTSSSSGGKGVGGGGAPE